MMGVTKAQMLLVAFYMTVVLRAKHYGLPDMVNPLICPINSMLATLWVLRELTSSPSVQNAGHSHAQGILRC